MRKPKLVPEAHLWHKLWSIRLALFWGAVCGLYSGWSAFQGVIPAPIFAAASVLMCAAIACARVMKQPGVDP